MATPDRTSPDAMPRTQQLDEPRRQARFASIANLVLGTWLLVSPFVLAHTDVGAAVWNELTVGTIVAGLALYRVVIPQTEERLSWINVVAGGWLVVSPFLLGYGDVTAAVTNEIVVGASIVLLGLASIGATRRDR